MPATAIGVAGFLFRIEPVCFGICATGQRCLQSYPAQTDEAKQIKLQTNMSARNLSARLDTGGESSSPHAPPVIDYEGSQYRTDFWDGQDRQYEDAVERLALQALLPAQGGRIAEIGAGFGRLADLYLGYRQIVLFDYSRTLLREAAEQWGHDPRFIFVAGNVYDLPLASEGLDALVMVRVMHHLVDVPRALQQLRRVVHRDGVAVVEYANKRNLKALSRWFLGRQTWSPIDPAPVEFVKLNFDFHPAWMRRRFEQARFRVARQWAVSHFRLPLFKQMISARQLAALDRRLFVPGGKFPLAPSVFVQLAPESLDAQAPEDAQVPDFPFSPAEPYAPSERDEVAGLFCCPRCFSRASFHRPQPQRLVCGVCDAAYGQHDGIWDFKELLS